MSFRAVFARNLDRNHEISHFVRNDKRKSCISYSHDSPSHEAWVLALADRLRADGIDAMIDQYQTAPPEGWQLWMEKQIRDARFVLLVCTETYCRRVIKEDAGKGLGVMWESAIIYTHLYNAGVVTAKFIPIVFDHSDTKHIPIPVQPTTYYDVSTDAGYESLLSSPHQSTCNACRAAWQIAVSLSAPTRDDPTS